MTRLVCVPILAMLLPGCLAEVATTTAIQGTLQAQQLGAMQRQIKGAAESTGKINIGRAITTYQAEKGAYPPSLEALVPGWLPELPTHPDGASYGYDPTTGTLYDTIDAAGNAIDSRTIQQIQSAINQYGTAVGYYPPTLDALAPVYLPAPPRTAAGLEFSYNNQNGAVSLPPGVATVPPGASRVGGAPVGGAGPLGEAVTGIGISNQLDNMNSSGSAAAGSRARGAARGLQGAGDDRASAAMDNLGL